MFSFFTSSNKHKDTLSQKLTLKQAIQQLSATDEDSMRDFAKVLSDYSDHSHWVAIPIENIKTNEVVMFQEYGKIYVGMYSDAPSKRFSITVTDINKLFQIVFTADSIAGIVIDPETTQLYLEKDFLRKCLSLCEHSKYLPNTENSIKNNPNSIFPNKSDRDC